MDTETDPSCRPSGPPKSGPSVVIVGGGIAGISAARHLISHGVGRVRILEAKSRLGGRINTLKHGKAFLLL